MPIWEDNYKCKYVEPRDKALEKELLEYDDVDGYEDAIWRKYIQTEEDEDDEGKNDELELERRRIDTAVENIFIAVYNHAETYIPADEIYRLIGELNVWGDEYSHGLEEQLLKFLQRVKESSNNPPKKDKFGRIIQGELRDELSEIINKEYRIW